MQIDIKNTIEFNLYSFRYNFNKIGNWLFELTLPPFSSQLPSKNTKFKKIFN
jgi:hypothetical protein